MGPRNVAGLRDVADRYGLFFVDQFGVLHDGRKPYPGAVEALAKLGSDGRTVVILSNSGKRSQANAKRLEALGFAPSSWSLFLSSGEVAWQMLAAQPQAERPRRCFVLSRDGDTSPIDGLGIATAAKATEADLVLIAGSEGETRSLEEYETLLKDAAAAGIPAICANPDMTMLVHGGAGYAFGAGRIGKLYDALGGMVSWIGKPYPDIYAAARTMTGSAAKALGIGDSVEHDIAGAKAAGDDALLVRTGVMSEIGDLESVYAENDVRPDYVAERFAW